MRTALLPALLLVVTTPVLAQPGPFLPADLQYALHVCTDTTFLQVGGNTGAGMVADLGQSNRGCLASNEQNGVWMHVQVASAGQLAFTATPLEPIDLDFGVWGPFSAPVTALVAPPVRCSYASGSGATGMNYTAIDLTEGAAGDGRVRYLDVQPGEWYMVYISKFSAAFPLHFSLTWQLQGGASLACLEAPEAAFTGPLEPVLSGALVDFTDASNNHPYAWYWEFPGGEPATSTEQDPQGIVYNTVGCHDVHLTATNAAGSSTTTVPCAVQVELNTGIAARSASAFTLRQEAGVLHVRPADPSIVAEVRIVDLNGRVVASALSAGELRVPVGQLVPGMYAVELVQGATRSAQAVVVE